MVVVGMIPRFLARKQWVLAGGILLVVLVDRLTKYLAQSYLSVRGSVPIGPLLKLTYVENSGAAFGLFSGGNLFFVLVTLVVVALALRYYHDIVRSSSDNVWYALVVGGALGNLIDRLALGLVIDFIDLGFWPVFNVADSCLSIGIAGYLVEHWLETRKKKKS